MLLSKVEVIRIPGGEYLQLTDAWTFVEEGDFEIREETASSACSPGGNSLPLPPIEVSSGDRLVGLLQGNLERDDESGSGTGGMGGKRWDTKETTSSAGGERTPPPGVKTVNVEFRGRKGHKNSSFSTLL